MPHHPIASKKESTSEETPHYTGHRQRIRERFLSSDGTGVAEYELLEMILFAAHPRGDVKPLAKKLLSTFGSLAKVIQADAHALMQVEGMGESGAASIKVIEAAAQKLLLEKVKDKPVIQSWSALLDYCRINMAHQKIEQFRILFLNNKNMLIADEVQQKGTIDHTPVYPREVVKRALELGASAIILLHNHPSGDFTPSKADIAITRQISTAATALGVEVHDHLIIAGKGHFSFKSNGLL